MELLVFDLSFDDFSGDLLERLFPIIKRCLGRDENYDLRMDAAIVSNSCYVIIPPCHMTYR